MNKISVLINELIEKKYSVKFKPTREFYGRVGIGQKRFKMLIDNKVSPTLAEMQAIKEYFGLKDISELYENDCINNK